MVPLCKKVFQPLGFPLCWAQLLGRHFTDFLMQNCYPKYTVCIQYLLYGVRRVMTVVMIIIHHHHHSVQRNMFMGSVDYSQGRKA